MKNQTPIKSLLLIFVSIIIIQGQSHAQSNYLGKEYTGFSSYYSLKFNGRKTASGEFMKSSSYTCAHKTLAFGTMLEVTNLANNKSVVVRVNDRGPFIKSRILDISYAAAQEIGLISRGIAKVKIVVIGEKGEVLLKKATDSTGLAYGAYIVPIELRREERKKNK
jgi:rare lipoprotein A